MQLLELTTNWIAVYYRHIKSLISPLTNEVVMYKFIQSSEEINSNGGFSFINKLLNDNKGMDCWDSLLPAARNSLYSISNIIRSLIGHPDGGRVRLHGHREVQGRRPLSRACGRESPVGGVVQAAAGQAGVQPG